MNIFITGIAGMIGYHTATQFARNGHNVFGIDNFNDYYDVNLKHKRAEMLSYRGVKVTKVDIENYDYKFVPSLRPDVVIHLAAYANPRHALEEPWPYINTNIGGTQRLIDNLDPDIPVIYASSSCVMHGQPLPWNEHDRPLHQNNPYGWSKRANECQFMHSKIGRSMGLRFFTVYGPWGRPDMALFKFTKQIIKGETLTVYNYGDMKRDFTYVQDIVDGIVLLTHKIISDDDNYHEIFNIGYGRQVNLMDFIHEIEKNLGIKGKLDLVPAHPADVPETWSDTTKLRNLGYDPKVSIEDGVARFVEWYKHYYGIN